MKVAKGFLKSKLNWLGIIMVLSAVYDYIKSDTTTIWNFHTISLFVFGLAVIVLRTYFTQVKVSGTL